MNKKYNILILSAGRRVELVKCFKNAANRLKIKSKIVAVDLSDTAPAIYFADKHYRIPRIGTPDYLSTLIKICNEEDIKLIVPTIDTELLVLAKEKNNIEKQTNAKVLISELDVISICRDKIKSQKFFEDHGFGVPKLYSDSEIEKGELKYPLFIKPLDGSSSINTFKIENQSELEFFYKYIQKPIVQEFIEGTEYTVDAFLDFQGNPITIVPRIRIATRSGEIAKGMIVRDEEIIQDVYRLLQELRPIGHVTIQCMKTDCGIKYIEINPRFGGGAPMSILSGADSCEKLYRLLDGERLEFQNDFQEKNLFLRFDSTIALNENMEILDDKSSCF